MWQLICFIVNEQTDKFGYREMMGLCLPSIHIKPFIKNQCR